MIHGGGGGELQSADCKLTYSGEPFQAINYWARIPQLQLLASSLQNKRANYTELNQSQPRQKLPSNSIKFPEFSHAISLPKIASLGFNFIVLIEFLSR